VAVELENTGISMRRQCELLSLPRSTWKYEKKGESVENLMLMKIIDENYSRTPFYGVRKWTVFLNLEGFTVNHKRVGRLKNKLGLSTLFPKKKWKSSVNKEHKKYPYLLQELEIDRPNQVWSMDITYIKMEGKNYYLTAVLDWHSRYILGWELSKTMESGFCQAVLLSALNISNPEIFNTDQGSQFTADGFVNILLDNKIEISMDGKGRCFDNIRMERFWRSIKVEEIYLKEYNSFSELKKSIGEYILFYNNERFHQSLDYRTPAEVYFEKQGGPLNHLKFA
jgi:putative transposase